MNIGPNNENNTTELNFHNLPQLKDLPAFYYLNDSELPYSQNDFVADKFDNPDAKSPELTVYELGTGILAPEIRESSQVQWATDHDLEQSEPQADLLLDSNPPEKQVYITEPIKVAVQVRFELPLLLRKEDITDLKVQFKTDKDNLTDMCDQCGRKIITKSTRNGHMDTSYYVFSCNPTHKMGRRKSKGVQPTPNVTLHVQTTNGNFLVPVFLTAGRHKH